MRFDRSIFENRHSAGRPFLAAHRGVSGANIPCNTLLSYKIAVMQGADVVELDVSKSKDGKFFVFHPGMEPVFLKCGKYISEMTAEEVARLTIVNCDDTPTSYHIPTLQEAFALLKDKVYINVDKFWTDIAGISEEIRRAGVEKQVIVKTRVEENTVAQLEKFAPDLMFMAIVGREDRGATDMLLKSNVKYIGNEILFSTEEDGVVQDDYIRYLHENGLLVWVNPIVYDERDVISAGHTDDAAFSRGSDYGWGLLIDNGSDILQTDWLLPLKEYICGQRKKLP